MASAFDYFDRIFCINLDRRPERWAVAQQEFRSVGISQRVERFAAIERAKGAEGCLESHQQCVRLASEAGAERVLIFEDDVHFVEPVEGRLAAALEPLDREPWELFFLGADVVSRAQHIGEHLIVAKMLQCHAYAVHRRAFDKVAEARAPIDSWFAEHMRCYGARAPLAVQRVVESDIGHGITDRDVSRGYEIFVEASDAEYVAKRFYYKTRRRVGHALTRAARSAGIPLTFEKGRPKLER